MTEQLERYFCRACVDGAFIPDALKLAEEYAASLKPEDCVQEEVYGHRLRTCGLCCFSQGHTCRICGCFVVVRAKRRNMDCPDPGGSRWIY